MLTNKDLFEEIRNIENVIKELNEKGDIKDAAQLKVLTLMVKLLHNLRTNMVAVMKHLNVDLVKPSRRSDDDTTQG